jgi:hypothetical protein
MVGQRRREYQHAAGDAEPAVEGSEMMQMFDADNRERRGPSATRMPVDAVRDARLCESAARELRRS